MTAALQLPERYHALAEQALAVARRFNRELSDCPPWRLFLWLRLRKHAVKAEELYWLAQRCKIKAMMARIAHDLGEDDRDGDDFRGYA